MCTALWLAKPRWYVLLLTVQLVYNFVASQTTLPIVVTAHGMSNNVHTNVHTTVHLF